MKRSFRVRPRKGPLQGAVQVPGDKSIGHRALLFAALAEGPSRITGLSGGLDNRATAEALRAMGVSMTVGEREAAVEGVGLRGLRMASGPLDCGNSGTSMRLLAGLLAAQRFGSTLVGDASLTGRPMRRIVDPLRARGAHIQGEKGKKEGECYPPLRIAPLVEGELLLGFEYEMPVASAQVKSALLLSGLYAGAPTALSEPVLSRDHTERMMMALGVPLQTAGPVVRLDPAEWSGRWDGFEWHVPGDPSSAAFPLAAALAVGGSRVRVEGVCNNPTRTGFLEALRHMGALGEIVPKGDGAGGEPLADVEVTHGALRPLRLGGELVTRMIDEVPVFAALAATVSGTTEIRDATELRVKESDRVLTTLAMLRAFGADADELPDGMAIRGGQALRGGHVESRGDHRIAMAAVVLALAAEGESTIGDVDCVDTSFPGFVELMHGLGADIEEVAP